MDDKAGNPKAGSKDVAEARFRNQKMRQYASAELAKQKKPGAVIHGLVSMGMDKNAATEMVNDIIEFEKLQAKEESERKSKGVSSGIRILIGVVMIVVGFVSNIVFLTGLSTAEIDMSAFNVIAFIVGMLLYIFGIIIVIRTILKKLSKKNRERLETVAGMLNFINDVRNP